ncbi:apolipoprotein N-acyltransferase [Sinobacterium caligoides]|uniref:Apolipoprotein N-acyltransferase n=1 Tax=Sinobacterium caligoides TaxID=933926 RepID=A0A3N2DRI6_9GAMM|nr:apolipoprotein N-acyltransferase [Sinobacterium caligoides]ROS01915.1 apolipoprotein N-acyltransferase [Sinobacterium caligoides]
MLVSGTNLVRLGLVSLSILLSCLSNPGGLADLSWLAWISLAPLFIAVRGSSAKSCAGLFFFWGFCWWAWSIDWLTPAIAAFTGSQALTATVAWLCLSALLALPYAVIGIFWSLIQFTAHSVINALLSALLFSSSYIAFATLIPGSIAQTQFENLAVIQLVDIGGVGLLLFTMVLFNKIIANICSTNKRKNNRLHNIAAALLLTGGVFSYGYYSIDKYRAENTTQQLRVGLIQPNLSPQDNTLALFDLSKQLSQQHSGTGPELIVWPEFPPAFSWQESHNDRQRVTQLIEQIETPILLNSGYVYPTSNSAGNRDGYYNANQLISADGKLIASYHKQQLVPFFEFLPLQKQLPILSRWFPETLNYKTGPAADAVEITPTIHAATPICYEILFSERLRLQDFNIIINPSNDSWFDHRSRASISHLALGTFRAIEYRSPWLRVSNGGISLALDSRGDVVDGSRLNANSVATGIATLPIFNTQTLYQRYGLVLNYGGSALTIFCLIIGYNRQRKYLEKLIH